MLTEDNKTALEHGWRWFEYHAQQRLTVYKYYLIIMGAVGLALYTLHSAGHHFPAAAAAATGVVISFAFLALDHRVSQLVKLGEELMNKEEELLRDGTGHIEALISSRSNQNKARWLGSYSRAFRLIFGWAVLVLVIVLFWEVYILICDRQFFFA